METKTDELDVLDMPIGYMYYAKHRQTVVNKSGGIIVIYKESEYVQWVEINTQLESNL